MKNNPFYIDYCYGLLICGLLFLFPSSTIFPIIGILFFPEICYIIYNILTSKGQNSGVSQIARLSIVRSRLLNVRELNQSWHNNPTELNLKREKFEILYNRKKTLLYTFVLSISLIILFMLYLQF